MIWNIADDVLRDVYMRGKYRDVILPMTVIRRLDAVLEPAKKSVLEMKERLDKAGIVNQDPALKKELLKRLSSDLTSRFGRGFSQRNLEQMRLFYLGW